MRLEGELIAQYQQMHSEGIYYKRGSTLRKYVSTIAKIVKIIPTETILDYGSGRGLQYTEERIHEAWGIMPTLFDPGVPGIDELPEGMFDGVLCTGVLEHIPQDELGIAIANLVRYADKWCFIIVGSAPSKKRLPDGRQVHVTLRPNKWWEKRIGAAFAGRARVWLGFLPP